MASPAVRTAVSTLLFATVAAVSVYNYAAAASSPPREGNPFREFNRWINTFVFPASTMDWADETMGPYLAHYVLTYVRDFMGGSLLYYITGGLWHLYIYWCRGAEFFPDEIVASKEMIWDQIMLAQASTFMYAGLPVLGGWFIEEGYTLAYYSVDEVGGWVNYFLLTTLYLTVVEVGVYWAHRTLHTNKFLYKYVHALHHKYNRPDTLSPWASIAFNPMDGITQASPYVVTLFLVPCHYWTHMAMFFFTAIWATNIHDTVPGNSEPVMGAKYHTVHHTHYHVNFGQFFTFCDRFWGTLRKPEDMKGFKDNRTLPKKKAA